MKEVLAFAGGGGRRLSAREEELLGLLAGFPDGGGGGDRELSFSDLVEAGATNWPPTADADLGAAAPSPREGGGRPCTAAAAAALSSSPGKHEASKRQRQQAARYRAAWRSSGGGGGSTGSCGGGGEGVLLNFYVPGLLTRSTTTPRPSRGGPPSPSGAVQGAPAKPVTTAAAGGKASRTQTTLGIGCWASLWGRGRRPAKVCS